MTCIEDLLEFHMSRRAFVGGVAHKLAHITSERAYVRDAVVIVGVCSLVFIYAVSTDLLRRIHSIIHGTWGADQIFLVTFVLSLAMLVFAYRRVRELAAEIKARKAAEADAQKLARHDPLTGLPNRRFFAEKLQNSLREVDSERRSAILMLDLDGFKPVNDVHGHGFGDEVLIEFAGRIAGAIGPDDVLARLGGDEFAILQTRIGSLDEPARLARRVLGEMESPFAAAKSPSMLGVCVGIAIAPDDGVAAENLVRRADVALYRAKLEGRSMVRFFEPEMDEHVERRAHLERELRQALSSGKKELEVHYQPMVDLDTDRIVGFEALARWRSPTHGAIPPDVFIPIAEEASIIHELSDHLLRMACRDAQKWPSDLILAFNISPCQLRDLTFGLRILSILGKSGFDPRRLEIEITESALIKAGAVVEKVIGDLRAAGVRIALDDFGTGYATMSQLLALRFDRLKIDKSFVQRLNKDPRSMEIIRAVTGLARGLGLAITAEGIEVFEQVTALQAAGRLEGQGYLFGQPVPAGKVPALLSTGRNNKQRAMAAGARG